MSSRLTLHRSLGHAQVECDVQDFKMQQLLRRRKKEGWASSRMCVSSGKVQFYPFKPLGVPMEKEQIVERTTAMFAEVDRIQKGVTPHGDLPKKRDTRTTSRESKPQQSEGQGACEEVRDLFRDLPRCTRRDQSDGIGMMHQFVRESEKRVQQVKSLVPDQVYGLSNDYDVIDYLVPPRADYPTAKPSAFTDAKPEEDMTGRGRVKKQVVPQPSPIDAKPEEDMTGRGRLQKQVVPQPSPTTLSLPPKTLPSGARPRSTTAREAPARNERRLQEPLPALASSSSALPLDLSHVVLHSREAERRAKICPGRPAVPQAFRRQVYVSPLPGEIRPRPLPVRLPSLAEFIESSGLAMDGRGERGEAGRLREQINKLLPLPRAPVKEDATARRGRTDIRRKIEKQLDSAWSDRAAYKRCFDKSLIVDGSGVPADFEWPSVSEAVVAPEEVGEDRRKKREWTEEEEARAYAKVELLLREPDPTISPVARLQSTLQSYQAVRDRHRGDLQTALYSMDADRLHSLHRRAVHLRAGSTDVATSCALMRIEAEKDMLSKHLEGNMQRQYLWYRELWYYLQATKKELPTKEVPRVAHFIFDFVKQVLEYGKEFKKQMYDEMLSQIQNEEYDELVSALVVHMVDGIEDVTTQDLLVWFKEHRGPVPDGVSSSLAGVVGRFSDVSDEAELGEKDSNKEKSSQSVTFMTDIE